MKRWHAAALALGLVIAGCLFLAGLIPGTERSAIRRAKALMAASLIDPGSAQFRSIIVSRPDQKSPAHQRWICGEVNGKNRMGAFAGFTPFRVREDGSDLSTFPETDITADQLQREDEQCSEDLGEEYPSGFACREARDDRAKYQVSLAEQLTFLDSCRAR